MKQRAAVSVKKVSPSDIIEEIVFCKRFSNSQSQVVCVNHRQCSTHQHTLDASI